MIQKFRSEKPELLLGETVHEAIFTSWCSSPYGEITTNEARVLRLSPNCYIGAYLQRFPLPNDIKPLIFKGSRSEEIEDAFYGILFQEDSPDNVLEIVRSVCRETFPSLKVYFIGDINEVEHDGYSYLRGFVFIEDTNATGDFF